MRILLMEGITIAGVVLLILIAIDDLPRGVKKYQDKSRRTTNFFRKSI